MKKIIYPFLFLNLILFSCESAAIQTPPSPCSNIPPNQVCFDDQMFTMNAMAWTNTSNSSYTFYLDREDILGQSGPYIINLIMLYDGSSSGIPGIGVYNMVSWPDTNNANKQMCIWTQVEDDSVVYYYPDTTSIGTFEITAINGTNISGTVNCKMTDTPWTPGVSNSKVLKINFVDVPYQ